MNIPLGLQAIWRSAKTPNFKTIGNYIGFTTKMWSMGNLDHQLL